MSKSKFRLSPMLVAGIVVLVAAMLLQLNVLRRSAQAANQPKVEKVPLATFMPASLPGRVTKDLPLGSTEAAVDRVEGILKYDDFIYRSYTASSGTIAIYIAYWVPDKIPTRLVAAHTPDRCWSNSGWDCVGMRFSEVPQSVHRLKPAHWRQFIGPDKHTEYVLFWHLVGDRLYDYGERFNRMPSPGQLVRDSISQFSFGPQEQYFIRLTSDQPFEDVQNDAGFHELLGALAALGLADAGSATGK